jgi:hypothetical protein
MVLVAMNAISSGVHRNRLVGAVKGERNPGFFGGVFRDLAWGW